VISAELSRVCEEVLPHLDLDRDEIRWLVYELQRAATAGARAAHAEVTAQMIEAGVDVIATHSMDDPEPPE